MRADFYYCGLRVVVRRRAGAAVVFLGAPALVSNLPFSIVIMKGTAGAPAAGAAPVVEGAVCPAAAAVAVSAPGCAVSVAGVVDAAAGAVAAPAVGDAPDP
jgi:hypothetical protein